MKRVIGYLILASIGYYLWRNHFRRLFQAKDQVQESLEEVRLKNEIGDNKRAVFLAHQIPTSTIGDTPFAGVPLTALSDPQIMTPKGLQLLPKGGTTSPNPFDRVLAYLNAVAVAAILSSSVQTVEAAVPLNQGIYKSVTYVNADKGSARACGFYLTNICGRARAGDLVVIGPGHYYIPTNQFSLNRPGVDLYFHPGALVTAGTPTDPLDGSIFDDVFPAVAKTNRIMGYGQFISSNQLGRVLLMQDPLSKIRFECDYSWVLGQSGCIEQDAGELIYTARSFTRAEQYDAYLSGLGGVIAKVHFTSAEVYAGDSLIEMGTGVARMGDAVFNVNYAETLPGGGGIQALSIGSNGVMNISSIRLTTASVISGTLTNLNDPGTGVLQNCTITALPASTVSPIAPPTVNHSTSFKLKNCTIIGPTGVDPMDINPTAGQTVIEDCTILCGLNSTNWARATLGARNVRLYGRLTTNKTNHANVTVIGHTYVTNIVGSL